MASSFCLGGEESEEEESISWESGIGKSLMEEYRLKRYRESEDVLEEIKIKCSERCYQQVKRIMLAQK